MQLIDSHIHLDTYPEEQRRIILNLPEVDYYIAVSMDLASCKTNHQLALHDPRVKPAYGFHPEQELPKQEEAEALFRWMEQHVDTMVAVGEVGLPYYKRQENPGLEVQGYIELLEKFILFAKKHNKPIVLHAVYEDGAIACDLLEKHGVTKAHFHWFKGEDVLIKRMIDNGYSISITPDICYEKEIQHLASLYPLDRIMLETDGPWPFEGPFRNRMTNPLMIRDSMYKLAEIKGIETEKVWEKTFRHSILFYGLYNGES